MRISPVLLLLPVLVLSGSSAIANDDRPASPQPAIVSPVAAPLTIESLAGTYQPVINEQWVASYLEDVKKLRVDKATLKTSEDFVRRTYDKWKITIYADGRFEFQERDSKAYGNVMLNGSKLIFTIDTVKPGDGTSSSTNPSQCSECTFTLYISADRKTLLVDKSPNYSGLLHGFMKQ